MIKYLMLTFLVSFSLSATAADYLVSFETSDAQGTFAAPSIVVSEGVEATVSVGQRFEGSVIVSSHSDATAAVRMNLVRNGKEHSPSLLVNLGEKSAFSIGDLHVEFKVEQIDS